MWNYDYHSRLAIGKSMTNDMDDAQRELEYQGDVDYLELIAEANLIAQGHAEILLVSFAPGNQGRMERDKLCGRLDDDAKFKELDVKYWIKAAHYRDQPTSIVIRRSECGKLAS